MPEYRHRASDLSVRIVVRVYRGVDWRAYREEIDVRPTTARTFPFVGVPMSDEATEARRALQESLDRREQGSHGQSD